MSKRKSKHLGRYSREEAEAMARLRPVRSTPHELEVQHTLDKANTAISHLFSKAASKMAKRSRSGKRKGNKKDKICSVVPYLVGKNCGFPDRYITKLRYTSFVLKTSTTGTISKQAYRANSVYDPDLTGAGAQPLYFDQLAAVYDQYTVIKSKIRVQFMNTTANLPILCGINGDDDGTAGTNVETLTQSNNSTSRLLGTQTGGNNFAYMSQRFNCKRNLGINAFNASGDATAAINGNPTEEFDYIVWFVAQDGASTTTANYKVDIEYTVIFTELSTITGS